MKYIHKDGGTIRYGNGNMTYGFSLKKRSVNNVWTTISQAPAPNYNSSTFQPSSGTHSSPWYDTGTELNVSMNISNIYLEAGEALFIHWGW
jgi:L,D-peptidoglycan transpeptidase YkuD (ErfK/YbiS/YcfS/YnhG family)